MTSLPQRILIVRPSALGDVARTVPALVSLKRAFPSAKIDWLVNDNFVDVIASHPDVHEAIAFPRKRFGRAWRSPSVMRQLAAYLLNLRRRRYDRVYDLQGLSRSGWLTWVTGSKHRVGPRDARELAWLGYNRRVGVPDTTQHTVDRMLTLLEADGVSTVRDIRLYIAERDRHWHAQWVRDHAIGAQGYVVVAPTAAWASKCWPIERFRELIGRLPAWGFTHCVVVGGPGDVSSTRPLLDAGGPEIQCVDLVGGTSVGQLMAVLGSAAVVMANDSAALHLAVGLGRRSVGIFGPTDPAKVGPYHYSTGLVAMEASGTLNYRGISTDQSVIAGISVERVCTALQQVMDAPPPRTVLD